MDHTSIQKVSPSSDCSKHAQATVWLPWEGFNDSQQDPLQRTQENPKQIKTTKQKEVMHREKKKRNPPSALHTTKKKLQKKGKFVH